MESDTTDNSSLFCVAMMAPVRTFYRCERGGFFDSLVHVVLNARFTRRNRGGNLHHTREIVHVRFQDKHFVRMSEKGPVIVGHEGVAGPTDLCLRDEFRDRVAAQGHAEDADDGLPFVEYRSAEDHNGFAADFGSENGAERRRHV